MSEKYAGTRPDIRTAISRQLILLSPKLWVPGYGDTRHIDMPRRGFFAAIGEDKFGGWLMVELYDGALEGSSLRCAETVVSDPNSPVMVALPGQDLVPGSTEESQDVLGRMLRQAVDLRRAQGERAA